MGNKEMFEMTKDHLTLLTKMYVGWQDCETGAPEIDPKRPYGNSDVELDIAEILGWELFVNCDEEKQLSKKQFDMAQKLHKETKQALQICLLTQSFIVGVYEKKSYSDRSWILVS
jgi:hypothetical protein